MMSIDHTESFDVHQLRTSPHSDAAAFTAGRRREGGERHGAPAQILQWKHVGEI